MGGELRIGGEKAGRRRGTERGGQRRRGGAAPRFLTYPCSMGGAALGSLGGRDAQDDSVVAVVGPRVCVVAQGVISVGFDQRIGFGPSKILMPTFRYSV